VPTRDFDSEYQDNAERKYAYDFDEVIRRHLLRAFSPLLPAGRALELGCFTGQFTELLSTHYHDLTVVDAAGELIALARQRVGDRARFVHSAFEEFAPDTTYDAIFLVHTLEHLDEPVEVLARIRGWLSPQGRLFLVTPNANAPSRQIAVHMGLITHNAAVTEGERLHGHRRTYSLDTLERDARAGGLGILDRGGVLFKALANFQFDKALATGVVDAAYVEGCYQLGMIYPDLCASVYVVCTRDPTS
jgi:2-polyprenyl-3-methyl-5-hydroxy-6-metoxy-1,4-benzoquinol methylase